MQSLARLASSTVQHSHGRSVVSSSTWTGIVWRRLRSRDLEDGKEGMVVRKGELVRRRGKLRRAHTGGTLGMVAGSKHPVVWAHTTLDCSMVPTTNVRRCQQRVGGTQLGRDEGQDRRRVGRMYGWTTEAPLLRLDFHPPLQLQVLTSTPPPTHPSSPCNPV
jgi:hypothetical protein